MKFELEIGDRREIVECIYNSLMFLNSVSDYDLTIDYIKDDNIILFSGGEEVARLHIAEMRIYLEGLQFSFCRSGART